MRIDSKPKIPNPERLRKIAVRHVLGFGYWNLGSCFLLLCLVAGCVSTTDFDAVKADVNQLKRDTFELKKTTSEIQKDLDVMKQLMATAAKEESFNALRESQTSLYSQVSDVSKDLQVLKGRFDESKFFVDKTLKESTIERELLRSQISTLETQVKALNERLTKLSATAPSEKPAAEEGTQEEAAKREETPESKPAVGEGDDDPIKAYERAYNLYKEKKFREARDAFSGFLKRFPKDDLADNAQFWIGESYYAEKDFEGAILAYETLIKGHPQSEKLPGALLKQGLSFLELGDKKTAKVIFQKLTEKYPDSKEADLAKKKIGEIEPKPAKTKPKR